MRSGTSTQNAIVRMLPSGQGLEVLEADSGTGYTHVRTPSGAEGFVLTRFLMPDPSARSQLATLQRQLAEARATAQQASDEAQSLGADKSELSERLRAAGASNAQLGAELDEIREASANVITLQEQNRSLRLRLTEADQEIDELSAETRDLVGYERRQWFLVGSGVILAGVLLGIFLPRIRWRRRSSWDRM